MNVGRLGFICLCIYLFLLNRPNFHSPESVFFSSRHTIPLNLPNPSWVFRNLSHGTVNLVISEGKPKFEMHEVDPPKKEKWQTKKRLKIKRKREKQKRKEANKRDPRSLTVKRKKQKFANAEERIKYKLERVSILLFFIFIIFLILVFARH